MAYINDNIDALLCRLHMIEEAEEEVILSTFDFNADRAGKDMLSALLTAADRGVRVKVTVDGFSGFLDLRGNEWFQAVAAHENVEMKVYNPINFGKPWTMQARMHDKYVICDRKIYMLGGRNTANLFLGDYSSSKNIDRELLVYETDVDGDSSVNQVLSYFDTIWNRPESKTYRCKDQTKPWGCTDYLNQKKKIWGTGVKVYEFMGEHSCHTKAVLIDDRMSIVGSYNMDMRSTYQDTELMLAVDSKALNAVIRKEAELDKTYSKTAGEDGVYTYGKYYEEKELHVGKKIFYGILRVVTIPLRRFL